VNKEKTPSQTLRAVIYRIWERKAYQIIDFENYYKKRMHEIIEKTKLELD